MTLKRLSRRSLLISTGVVVAGGALASYATCTKHSAQAAMRLDRLDVVAERIRNARKIGANIRAKTAFSDLVRSLRQNAGLVSAMEFECSEKRLAVVREQITRDFRSGAVIVENRWVLSKTEGLVAALCA